MSTWMVMVAPPSTPPHSEIDTVIGPTDCLSNMAFTLGTLTYIPIRKCPKCSFNMLHCIFYATHVFSVQMPVCCICSWVIINTQDMDYKNWWNQTPPMRGNHYPWWDRELIQNTPLGRSMRHVHEGAFRSCLLRWEEPLQLWGTPSHGLGSSTALNG